MSETKWCSSDGKFIQEKAWKRIHEQIIEINQQIILWIYFYLKVRETELSNFNDHNPQEQKKNFLECTHFSQFTKYISIVSFLLFCFQDGVLIISRSCPSGSPSFLLNYYLVLKTTCLIFLLRKINADRPQIEKIDTLCCVAEIFASY